MTCPHCDGETRVVDSRPTQDNVRRRRQCLICGERFTTVEVDIDMFERMQGIEASRKIKEAVDQAMRRLW